MSKMSQYFLEEQTRKIEAGEAIESLSDQEPYYESEDLISNIEDVDVSS